jgi:hypothetical protein
MSDNKESRDEEHPVIIQYTELLHKHHDPNAAEVKAFVELHRDDEVFLRRAETLNRVLRHKDGQASPPAAAAREEDGWLSPGTASATQVISLLLGCALGAVMGTAASSAPDVAEAQIRLRNVLKDPAKTDELLKKLQDIPTTREFLDDPEVLRNLAKLMAGIDGHLHKSLDESIERLRQKKDLLDATAPKKWTETTKPAGELKRGS